MPFNNGALSTLGQGTKGLATAEAQMEPLNGHRRCFNTSATIDSPIRRYAPKRIRSHFLHEASALAYFEQVWPLNLLAQLEIVLFRAVWPLTLLVSQECRCSVQD